MSQGLVVRASRIGVHSQTRGNPSEGGIAS
jgi:hypothetical protein